MGAVAAASFDDVAQRGKAVDRRMLMQCQKTALSIGGSLAAPSTAYQYDRNMLPLGQQLWLDWFETLRRNPPMQSPMSYSLNEVMDQIKASTTERNGRPKRAPAISP